MRLVVLGAAACFLSTAALAQSSIYDYSITTIDNSIKCELAKVDKLFRRGPNNLPVQARITVVKTDTKNTKVGASLDIFNIGIGGSYEREVTDERTRQYLRNINIKNSPNCSKRNVVDIPISDCFRESIQGNSAFLDEKGSKIVCKAVNSATGELTGSGKVKVWLIDVGPSGKLSLTRKWSIEISAPPPSD